MKFVLALALSLSSVAFAGETILTCTRTTFRDLDKIVITQGTSADEVVVTEIDEAGRESSYTRSLSDLKSEKGIELSGWYGYTRILSNSGNSWGIEHFDECGGGWSYATCQ